MFLVLYTDINGDGLSDLITPNVSTRNVSVLLGTANGMFQAPVSSSGGGSVGMLPQAVAIADFTGDGSLDVVTADYNSNRLTLLVGNKTAAFSTGVSIGVSGGNGTIILPNYVISGDFNKDGKPDLAVPRIASMSNVVLLPGTGMQATPVGTPASYTAGGNPYALVAGDWNGDGNLDLAANNSMTNNVTVLLGSANGMMTVSGTQLGVGMRPEHIAAVDVNNDGLPDLVTANTSGGDLSLLLMQDRMPTYANAQAISPGSGITPKWVAAADLNTDGKADLVVADYKTAGSAGVIVLLNTSQ